jgi:hypothetical protein
MPRRMASLPPGRLATCPREIEGATLLQTAGRDTLTEPCRLARPQRGQWLDLTCSRSCPHQQARGKVSAREARGVRWVLGIVVLMAGPSLLSRSCLAKSLGLAPCVPLSDDCPRIRHGVRSASARDERP